MYNHHQVPSSSTTSNNFKPNNNNTLNSNHKPILSHSNSQELTKTTTNNTRKCEVTLPTDNLDRIVIQIPTKFKVMDVIDIIASKLQIDKHKNLFSLVYEPLENNNFTSDNHNSHSTSSLPFIYPKWLSSDKLLITDHEFIKKLPSDQTIRLHFRIKYYIRRFLELTHAECVNLYYNNARALLLKYSAYDAISLQCHINLAALQLQAEYGNFSNYVHQQISNFIPNVLSRNLVKNLKERGSQTASEKHILSSIAEEWRSNLNDIGKDQCVVRFLQTLETQCPMYGVHYRKVTTNIYFGETVFLIKFLSIF